MAGPAIPDTLSTTLGAIGWIPVAIWIVTLVNWTITADIDPLSGFLGIITGLCLGYFTFKPPIPILSPVFFCFTWLTVLLYPAIRSSLDKRALVAIDIDTLARTYDALATKPDNIGLRLKIARLIFSRGLIGPAIVVAEESLKGLPEQLFQDEYKMLNTWKNSAGNPTHYRSLPCLECGYANAAGRLHCERCGAPFLLHHAQGKWLGPNLARRVISGWAAGVALIVGVPAAATLLQPWQAGIVIAALLAGSGALVWRAFKPERKGYVS